MRYDETLGAYMVPVGGEDDAELVAADGLLWLTDHETLAAVSQETARELLPLLQHFAETGTLPEPKDGER